MHQLYAAYLLFYASQRVTPVFQHCSVWFINSACSPLPLLQTSLQQSYWGCAFLLFPFGRLLLNTIEMTSKSAIHGKKLTFPKQITILICFSLMSTKWISILLSSMVPHYFLPRQQENNKSDLFLSFTMMSCSHEWDGKAQGDISDCKHRA